MVVQVVTKQTRQRRRTAAPAAAVNVAATLTAVTKRAVVWHRWQSPPLSATKRAVTRRRKRNLRG